MTEIAALSAAPAVTPIASHSPSIAPAEDTIAFRQPPVHEVVYLGYIGGIGGEATQPLELAAGMAARGIPVRFLAPDMDTMASMAEGFQGIPNLSIELTSLIQYDRLSQDPLKVLRLMRSCLRPHTPGGEQPVLHIHTGDICIARVNLLCMELLRPHRAFATLQSAKPEMAFGGPRARYWASVAPRRFQRIIAPSRHGRETQIAYGLPPSLVTTIYNCVDTRRFASGDAAVARRHLGVGENTPLIVSTSRLHPQKQPQDTIEAFARVAADFPEWKLIWVGAGPLEGEVRALVEARGLKDRVYFVGRQLNIPDWLAAATIWFQTSVAENFSLAVIEALAAGCPMVATTCSGNDEVLVDGENALTAGVGDVEALADRLRRLMGDASLRERLRPAAVRTAARYTRDRMVDEHLACYHGQTVAAEPAP